MHIMYPYHTYVEVVVVVVVIWNFKVNAFLVYPSEDRGPPNATGTPATVHPRHARPTHQPCVTPVKNAGDTQLSERRVWRGILPAMVCLAPGMAEDDKQIDIPVPYKDELGVNQHIHCCTYCCTVVVHGG